jgi:hypothetical protein
MNIIQFILNVFHEFALKYLFWNQPCQSNEIICYSFRLPKIFQISIRNIIINHSLALTILTLWSVPPLPRSSFVFAVACRAPCFVVLCSLALSLPWIACLVYASSKSLLDSVVTVAVITLLSLLLCSHIKRQIFNELILCIILIVEWKLRLQPCWHATFPSELPYRNLAYPYMF